MGAAYYNEIDPFAAQWLRNLIRAGHIAPGDVDERSIEDVHPDDLSGFTQCHFFAGIGVWSLALRRSGWPDDRPVWTGSCPCQPFSAAGAGAGFADERHLWPHFHWLIQERRPAIVFGEQVASRDADPWIDLVQDDLEGLGYRVGAIPFPAASVGAPHIRDRLYWVADSDQHGCPALPLDRGRNAEHHSESCGQLGDMGNAQRAGLALSQRIARISGGASRADAGQAIERAGIHIPAGPSPTNGFWRAADWLLCRDGKWRPVEPGTFPLAHGATARVGRLRAYGNAIVAPQAQAFIEVVMECMP